jgi:hypothetical protein
VFQENGGANEAIGALAEATRESCRTLVDGAFAAHKQYVKLALNGTDNPVEMFRNQAEIGRHMMQVLADQSARQQRALLTLASEPVKIYMDLLFAFTSSWAPGTSASEEREVDEDAQDLPVGDYDQLSVEEISRRLRELDAREVEKLRAYERRHRNRVTLLERFDRSLV